MTAEKVPFAAGDLVVYPDPWRRQDHRHRDAGDRRPHAQRLCRDVRQGPHDAARAAGQGQGFRAAQAVEPQGNGRRAGQTARPLAGQAHDVEPAGAGIPGEDRLRRPGVDRRGGARPVPQQRASPSSPTASGRSIRRRSTAWCANSPRSSGSTRRPRPSASSRCCRPDRAAGEATACFREALAVDGGARKTGNSPGCARRGDLGGGLGARRG